MRGTVSEIDAATRESMRGISMPDGAKVGYCDLRLLTVPHRNFCGGTSTGKLIIARELADEVLDIFAELYEIGYPIEKMELIDRYAGLVTKELNSLDNASMGHNNSSAFCYRVVDSTDRLSMHALGRAIDLNPKINPWIRGELIEPYGAAKYADRSGAGLPDIERRAMIRSGDAVCSVFERRGWIWGGDWTDSKDYQHFEKPKE
ncbi:MAG: M15 family metallopeptidase [Oscillospiraceae bacterium]|nr:M15 family metallopeptidase [Oscillospiraceae bacterium]